MGLKNAHNWPNAFFSQSNPDHSPQLKIDFSYYKYVPRLICLLICGFIHSSPKNTSMVKKLYQYANNVDKTWNYWLCGGINWLYSSFPLGDHSREAHTQRGADSQAAARGAAPSRLDLCNTHARTLLNCHSLFLEKNKSLFWSSI